MEDARSASAGSPDPRPGASERSVPGPVVLIAAMAEEAAPLIDLLDDPADLTMPLRGTERPVTAVRGRLVTRDAVVLTCGIGVAAAAAATAWAISALDPRAVVSVGSAGGLADGIEVGTVVVGEQFAYSIADATAFGYAAGQVPGQPVRFTADESLIAIARDASEVVLAAEERDGGSDGAAVLSGLMLSGDAFVTAPLAGPMRERFPGALTADMESTAIAQTCASADVPFVSVRCVSDLCGPRADQQFHLELDLVAERAAACAEALAVRID